MYYKNHEDREWSVGTFEACRTKLWFVEWVWIRHPTRAGQCFIADYARNMSYHKTRIDYLLYQDDPMSVDFLLND